MEKELKALLDDLLTLEQDLFFDIAKRETEIKKLRGMAETDKDNNQLYSLIMVKNQLNSKYSNGLRRVIGKYKEFI